MSTRFSNKSQQNSDKFMASLEEGVKGPVIHVLLNNICIAVLYHDGTDYCLTYTRDFLKTGLVPFNTNDLSKNQAPEIGKIYHSHELWHAFFSRLPSPKRDDYKRLLKSMGLSETEMSSFNLK